MCEEIWKLEDISDLVIESVDASDTDGGYDMIEYGGKKYILSYDLAGSLGSVESV